MSRVLSHLIEYSRDGEWGSSEPGEGLTKMRVVRGTDFDEFSFGNLARLPIRYVRGKKAQQKALQAGDILIETAGGTATRPTGRAVLVQKRHMDESDLPLICASFARFVRIDRELADPAYIYLWLDNAWRTRELLRYNTQHTGVARFQWTECAESVMIRLPERVLQERIAEPILAIDALIANNRRRIELLEQMAQAIYREWFVHFRYPNHENPTLVDSPCGPIPDGWCVVPLNVVATVNQSSRKPSAGENVQYLDISCIGDRFVGYPAPINGAMAPGRARRVVAANDVVWSMVRPNRRAHALLVDPGKDWIASTGLAVITPTCISPSLLFEILSDRRFSDYLVSRESGAAYPAVKPADFEAAALLVPSRQIDRKFEEVVGPHHRMIWKLREQSAVLDAMRDMLLPRLVTGQIDVSRLDLDALVEAAG